MVVICKMVQCPYNKKGYCCKRRIVSIDENGMCSVLWVAGQQKQLIQPFTQEMYPTTSLKITDTQILNDDVISKEENNNESCGETEVSEAQDKV